MMIAEEVRFALEFAQFAQTLCKSAMPQAHQN
jgi:hypothetical protein